MKKQKMTFVFFLGIAPAFQVKISQFLDNWSTAITQKLALLSGWIWGLLIVILFLALVLKIFWRNEG
jgi:hypothetical protein